MVIVILHQFEFGTYMDDGADLDLLNEYREKVYSRLPRIEEDKAGFNVIRATPLIDVTDPLVDCARLEYGITLDRSKVRVLGKLDSAIIGGSVKTRPAAKILEEAIASGKLRRGQPIFEATSGNFGIALGLLTELGFRVVVLVSRRIKEGVIRALESSGVSMIDLDVDICPAPAIGASTDVVLSKGLVENLKSHLKVIGFAEAPFEAARPEIERLLMNQDVINLAKLLARIYGGYCPEQYDNESNVYAHQTITAPEIEAQLREEGENISQYRLVCTFGTGGTSTGISRYLLNKYGTKNVHVIFPLSNQDVAGIRSRDKARGLKFYQPDLYSGEHEVDFEAAKKLLRFFVARGYDIGESSALALWGVINLINFGVGQRFVVMLADGASKYLDVLGASKAIERPNLSLEEAARMKSEFSAIIWTHPSFIPKKDGLNLIASSLGVDQSKVRVLYPEEVRNIIYTGELDHSSLKEEELQRGKVLLVCIGGGNSLRIAELLNKKGIKAYSLEGGLMSMSRPKDTDPLQLLKTP